MRSFACLSFLIVVLLLPVSLRANRNGSGPFPKRLYINLAHYQTDTLTVGTIDPKQEQDKKKQTRKKEAKDVGNKAAEPIKQVPKSRKQLKPTVVKPAIKVKPIKIIRPKIKKP